MEGGQLDEDPARGWYRVWQRSELRAQHRRRDIAQAHIQLHGQVVIERNVCPRRISEQCVIEYSDNVPFGRAQQRRLDFVDRDLHWRFHVTILGDEVGE